MKKIKIILLVFEIFLFEGMFNHTQASISGVKAYISNNETALVYGGNFSGSNSLFYLGNANRWSDCTKTTLQSASGTINWDGPNTIILNTVNFNKGEKAYLFHANSIEDLNYQFGYPVVIEKPNIIKCQNDYSTKGEFDIIIKGTGFTNNDNGLKVYLGNNSKWNNSTIKTEQVIKSWELDNILVKFVDTNLEGLMENNII